MTQYAQTLNLAPADIVVMETGKTGPGCDAKGRSHDPNAANRSPEASQFAEDHLGEVPDRPRDGCSMPMRHPRLEKIADHVFTMLRWWSRQSTERDHPVTSALMEQLLEGVHTSLCELARDLRTFETKTGPDPERVKSAESIEAAWGVIANVSGGDWAKQPERWQQAAAEWRDRHYYPNTQKPGPKKPSDALLAVVNGQA